jgi:hypothetical protein
LIYNQWPRRGRSPSLVLFSITLIVGYEIDPISRYIFSLRQISWMANKKVRTAVKKRQATGAAATATAMPTPNGTSDRYFLLGREIKQYNL